MGWPCFRFWREGACAGSLPEGASCLGFFWLPDGGGDVETEGDREGGLFLFSVEMPGDGGPGEKSFSRDLLRLSSLPLPDGVGEYEYGGE